MAEQQGMTRPSGLDVVRASLGADTDWIRVQTGMVSARAFTLAQLLAEDGRLLDDQQRRWFINEPCSPPERFSAFVGSVAQMTLSPALAVLRQQQQLPVVAFESLHFDLGRAAEGGLDVWWPDHVLLAEVDDVEAGLSVLIAQIIDFMTPLVSAMGPRVRVGPHKLWAQVVDALTGYRPRYTDPAPQTDRAFWEASQRLARATVLHQGDAVIEIPHRAQTRHMVRATACCFVYKQPPVPGSVQRYPWSSNRWAGYCMICPIIPTQETIARASCLLDTSES